MKIIDRDRVVTNLLQQRQEFNTEKTKEFMNEIIKQKKNKLKVLK